MARWVLAFALFAVCLVTGARAHADDAGAGARVKIDETFAAKSDAQVEILIVTGTIKVVGTSKNEVRVKGTRSGDAQLVIARSAERPRIHFGLRHPHRGDEPRVSLDADLEVQVPQGASVRVHTVTAPIDVRGVAGSIHAESTNGAITIAGSPAEVDARTVSGAVDVNGAVPHARVRSVSGSVRLRGGRGSIDVRTVSGECSVVAAGDLNELDVHTISSDVTVDAPVAAGAQIAVKAHSGRVVVKLPSSVNADVELRTHAGSLESRIGAKRSAKGSLDVKLGSGGAQVRVRTFSGDVTIEPRS